MALLHNDTVITLLVIISLFIRQTYTFSGVPLKFNIATCYPKDPDFDPCQGQGQCYSSCPHQRAAPEVRLVQQEVTFDPGRCLTVEGSDSSDSMQQSVGVTPGLTADAAPPRLKECRALRQDCRVEFDYDVTGRQVALSIILRSAVQDGTHRRVLETQGLVVTVAVREGGSNTLVLTTPGSVSTYNFMSTATISLLLQGTISDLGNVGDGGKTSDGGNADPLQVYINGVQVSPHSVTTAQPAMGNPPTHPEPASLRLGRGSHSGASGHSFVGSINQLDVFNRLLNASEIHNEAQYAALLLNNATYPQCLCAGSDVTAGFGCTTGSSRLGVPASVTDWYFRSPLGVSDGVVQAGLHYGYWEAPPEAYLKLELGLVYEVTRLQIYGHGQELEVFQHHDGLWFSVFCTPGAPSSTHSCNSSAQWEPVDSGPYQRLSWQPQVLPVLTDAVLIQFYGDSQPHANHVAEVQVYGRLVNHYMPDECVCFPGNGRTMSGTCDECGRCMCRDVIAMDDVTHADRYCSPYVTSVWPMVGPSAGGTVLTISGGLLLPASKNPQPTVTLGHGHVCHLNSSSSVNDTVIICTTSSLLTHDADITPIWRHGGTNSTHVKLPQKLTLNLSVGMTRVPLTTKFYFTYLPDPNMTHISPRHTFLRGGINVTVTGENFNSDLEPTMNIIETLNGVKHEHLNTQPCDVLNSTMMICQTPTIRFDRRRRRSIPLHTKELLRRKRDDVRYYLNTDRRTFTPSFDLVGITAYWEYTAVDDGQLFEVYEDPVIDVWVPNIKTFKIHLNDRTISIYGLRLKNGCTASDYSVMIGDMECTQVTLPYDNELVCHPPPRLTHPGSVMLDGASLVRVRVGYLDVAVGYLRYEYTIWDNRQFVTHVAVAVAGGVLFLLIILVVVFIVKVYRQRRRQKQAKKLAFDNEMLRYQGLAYNSTQGLLDALPQDLRDELNDCLIDIKRLQLHGSIGEGNFGKVFMGILDCDNENKSEVAVKTLRDSTGGLREVIEFLQEATIMRGFSHPHVLTMHGIVLDAEQVFVVLPFMKNGDLKSHLTKKVFTCAQYLGFCCDVARGMSYLADHKFIHRDLAARNCMVDHTERVLVADFGLARDIYEKDYYRIEDMNRPMPFKWMALEALRGFTFTSKSDVWSFGVLMWEVFTRGRKPYADVENRILRQHLSQGNRLEQPQNCSDAVYNVMKQCWHAEPEQRPSFTDLVQLLEVMIKMPQGANTNPPDVGDYIDQATDGGCYDECTSAGGERYCETASGGKAAGQVVQLPVKQNDSPAGNQQNHTPGGIMHHVPAEPNAYSVGPQLATDDSEDYLDLYDGSSADKGRTESVKGQAESTDYLQPVVNGSTSGGTHSDSNTVAVGVNPYVLQHNSNRVPATTLDTDYLQPMSHRPSTTGPSTGPATGPTTRPTTGPSTDFATYNGSAHNEGYEVPAASAPTPRQLLNSIRL